MSLHPKRLGRLIAAIALCASVLPAASPALAQRGCGDRVVIAIGETLSSIARRCGVTVDAIMAANPRLPSPYFILPGLPLQIPSPVVVRPEPAGVIRYVVRPGDTVASIARAHGMTMAQVFELNPDLDARSMRPGDVVRIRAGAPPPAADERPLVRYVVRRGDTLASIARAHDMTRAELRDLNDNVRARELRTGDVLLVRGPAPPPPPARVVSVAPARGAPGDVVKVSASGYPASARLRLLAGRDATQLRNIQNINANSRGTVNLDVRIPDWAASAGTLVFAFETSDGRLRTVSGPFRVVQSAPPPAGGARITVIGTLTREGAECQALRGDDGELYTLAGDFRGYQAGDRVRVQGRVAEVSTCMQGTTIDVARIEDWR